MHSDVHVQSIGDSDDDHTTHKLNKTRPTADTEEFFKPVSQSDKVRGDKKKRVRCMPCRYVLKSLFMISTDFFSSTGLGGCPKKEHILVGDVTTLRRHMQAIHKVRVNIFYISAYICSNCTLGSLPQMGEAK
jgi:hypothetical protein